MNDNTLLIMKYIKPILAADESLQAAMDVNKIYPLVANEGTSYPFIIYSRDSITPEYTKGLYGGWTNNLTFTIHVYSNDYEQSIIIANIVRNALEWRQIQNEDIKVNQIELISAYEQYNEDGYHQALTFQVNAT